MSPLLPREKNLLFHIATTIGHLSVTHLSGIELGSISTLSLSLIALLEADAPPEVFLSFRDKFSGFESDGGCITTLYQAALTALELAVVFDQSVAEDLVSSLLEVPTNSSTEIEWN